MGCANTKAGGAAVAEEGAPEGGDAQQQKELPKVMVDGDDVAVNGNVVNANGTDEGTTEEKEIACNGDLADSKRKSKISSDEGGEEATTPSGGDKSNSALNGEEAKMADEEEDTAQEGSSEGAKGDAEEAADSREGED